MAHVVKHASMTDELINVLTGLSPENNPSKFNAHHESALRILRSSNYARTNQFDVQHQLEGLEEKFRVYNKDDLADALRWRLDKLAKRSHKWSPEILHFLLELSDRPVANSDLVSLDFLEPTVKRVEPRYRWEDLAAEDPLLRDKHVWRNIDYGAESSDDEGLSLDSDLEASGVKENTTISSFKIQNLSRGANNFTVPADLNRLGGLETAQFWRSTYDANISDGTQEDYETSVVFITELQAIREVLFMLSGLPTSLFINSRQDTKLNSSTDDLAGLRPSVPNPATAKEDMASNLITPAPRYELKHASSQVFYGMMAQFAEYGSSILALRAWMQRKQSVPLLQSLQSEVVTRTRQFNEMISNMEARYVEPRENLVISLAEMSTKIILMARPLLQVSDIINVLNSEPFAHAFRFLELLYDRTCKSQMVGDDDLYEFLGTMFFDCFQVYLCQIRRWMEEGELWENDHVFFVSENTGDLELASLWLSRYKLRKTSNGTLHAPKFLHPATSKIFTTGKSVVVLKNLKKYDRGDWPTFVEEPTLDFQTVCGSLSISLRPFPDLFDAAFDQWVKSKHHVTSSALRKCLFDEYGLRDSLTALESIYFMVDGATTSQFANVLFEKLDSGKSNWNDRFSLTELAQSTIGSLPCVTAERLKASVSLMARVDMQRSRNSVKALNTCAFTYSLPWPVQIIIAKDSIPSYQKIFSFLLQIRRSASLLRGIRLVQTNSSANDSAIFYGVRSRLLWFTSTLYSYLVDLVIDPNTRQMHVAIGEGEDVDRMIGLHRGYMKKLIDQALLGSRLEPIHETIITILDLSTQLLGARTIKMTAQTEKDGFAASMHDISLRQSLRADPRTRKQALERARNADSSDEDNVENGTDPSTILAADVDLSYTDRMRKIRSQFDSLCKFVATGLRGVARAGGEPNWDILADKLESGLDVAV